MLCHIVHYRLGDETCWGVLHEGRVHALAESYPTTRAFLEQGRGPAYALLDALRAGKCEGAGVDPEHLELLSPVTADGRVLCQGINYRGPLAEAGLAPEAPEAAGFVTKPGASIAGPRDTVVRPPHIRLLDYEVELGLVLHGELREACDIAPSSLHRHVAGIVIGNDLAARDLQLRPGGPLAGSLYRGFCPVGPVLCLLEAEDMHYLEELTLECRVNGATRQQDSTANLVFKPAELLSGLSRVTDLLPGDLVLTGTPGGSALQLPRSGLWERLRDAFGGEQRARQRLVELQAASGRYLQPGDVMTLSIRSSDGAVDLGTQQTAVAGA